MTTIAIDRTHIAWDSQITVGSEKASWDGDKVWIVGNKVYGFAGDFGMLDEIVKWHQKGARIAHAPKEGNWELLVITTKGVSLYSNEIKYATKIIAPFAFGSGGPYARGALMHGATAYEAVKIACQCDVYSGGEIGVLKLEDAFKGRV